MSLLSNTPNPPLTYKFYCGFGIGIVIGFWAGMAFVYIIGF